MVEIIPKPKPVTPLGQNILLYLSILLLIGTISAIFVLDNSKTEAQTKLEDLGTKISEAKTPERKLLEGEVISWRGKINDFSGLLNDHLYSSNFFRVLEDITHPEVWFSEIDLGSRDEKVIISGQAEDFTALGQQLLIFQKSSAVDGVSLSKVSVAKEGGISFTFELKLNPQTLR